MPKNQRAVFASIKKRFFRTALSGNPDLNRGPQVPQTCTLTTAPLPERLHCSAFAAICQEASGEIFAALFYGKRDRLTTEGTRSVPFFLKIEIKTVRTDSLFRAKREEK